MTASTKTVAKKKARSPRYLEILEILRARIGAGSYPVGEKLPSEAEFCSEFGASRFTVREALRRLQEQGLLETQQGAGSRVIQRNPTGAFVQSYSSVADLYQFALDTHFEILDIENTKVDAELAGMIGGEAGEEWCFVRGLRSTREGGQALCLIESYIPIRFARFVVLLSRADGPLYAVLEEASGETVTSVNQAFQALEMPPHVSAALAAPGGSVSLRLLRRYQGERGTIIASFNWHLGGDRYIHRSDLSVRRPFG